MILLQFTAGQGPVECERAVAKAVARFTEEAAAVPGLTVSPIEDEPSRVAGAWKSVLLALDGSGASELAARWVGVIQWVCPSQDRPGVGRKNWFVGVCRFDAPQTQWPALDAVRFETFRASGAGGQHVNRTESAVRATHVPSGVVVRVESERSQHANKRLALALIASKLAERAADEKADAARARRQAHHRLERGSPTRVFRGPDFTPVPR